MEVPRSWAVEKIAKLQGVMQKPIKLLANVPSETLHYKLMYRIKR